MGATISKQVDDGGPAFSRAAGPEGGSHCNGHPGMSLRDYFAAKVLGGLMPEFAHLVFDNTVPESKSETDFNGLAASAAYAIADAMLKARAGK